MPAWDQRDDATLCCLPTCHLVTSSAMRSGDRCPSETCLLRHAGTAILITSATSAIAFFAGSSIKFPVPPRDRRDTCATKEIHAQPERYMRNQRDARANKEVHAQPKRRPVPDQRDGMQVDSVCSATKEMASWSTGHGCTISLLTGRPSGLDTVLPPQSTQQT